ncbi:MAG: aminoacyl-tRNA hydrolase [Phycisphaerae bacterium]
MGEPASDPDRRRLVVGLGNPGTKYAMTRHNVGWRVIDELVDRTAAGPGRDAFDSITWDVRFCRGRNSARVLLAKPLTFMNRSGRAVRAACDFYKVPPEDVLIVMDDLALETAQLRARAGGSAGGQKGLVDVIRQLGTDQVPRLRIGIGAAPPAWDAADYVLSKFTDEETELIGCAIKDAADAVEDWLFDGLQRVMERYNRRTGDK